MSKVDELEELDEENCEIETKVEFDLNWTCANCKEENTECESFSKTIQNASKIKNLLEKGAEE